MDREILHDDQGWSDVTIIRAKSVVTCPCYECFGK